MLAVCCGCILSSGFQSSDSYSPIYAAIATISSISCMVYLSRSIFSKFHNINYKSATYAFFLWAIFSFAHFYTSLHWISNALSIDEKLFTWLIPFTDFGIPFIISLFYGILGVGILCIVHWILLKNDHTHHVMHNDETYEQRANEQYIDDVVYLTNNNNNRFLTKTSQRVDFIHNIVFCMVFSTLWVVVELLRSYIILPFPWQLLGYSTTFSIEIMQLASITTVWGLSFLVAFFCAAITCNSRYYICECSALCIVTIIFIGGYVRLYDEDNTTKQNEGYLVFRIVQPNNNTMLVDAKSKINALQNTVYHTFYGARYPVYDKKFAADDIERVNNFDEQDAHHTIHLNNHNNDIAEGENANNPETTIKYNVDYYIWPESALPVYIVEHKDLSVILHNGLVDYLQKTVLSTGAGLIAGADVVQYDERKKMTTHLFNSMVLLPHNNDAHTKIMLYKKRILVPFGEYIPWRSILYALPTVVTMGDMDFTHGPNTQKNFEIQLLHKSHHNNTIGHNISHNRRSYITGKIVISPSICYEAIFAWPFAKKNNQHADLLLNITNDIWFGDSKGPYQHFVMARMRAIENNKPLIRVANFGISAIIDNKGRVISMIPLNRAGVIDFKFATHYLSLANVDAERSE